MWGVLHCLSSPISAIFQTSVSSRRNGCNFIMKEQKPEAAFVDIEFSCADYTFPLLSRHQRLSLIRLLDFSFVDLGLFARSPQMSPELMVASPAAFAGCLKEDLDRTGLSVADVFLQIGLAPEECAVNDPSLQVRERNRDIFQHTIELCISLSCKHLSGLPGVRHLEVEAGRDHACAVTETAWRLEKCAEAGIVYSVEAHMGSICADVESTRQFLAAVPGLTLTLDYGHFVASGEQSGTIHGLLPAASHIHVRAGSRQRLQTPLEDNQIDFAGMIDGLSRSGYTGLLALEYVWDRWQLCNRADTLSETILTRELLKQLGRSFSGVSA